MYRNVVISWYQATRNSAKRTESCNTCSVGTSGPTLRRSDTSLAISGLSITWQLNTSPQSLKKSWPWLVVVERQQNILQCVCGISVSFKVCYNNKIWIWFGSVWQKRVTHEWIAWSIRQNNEAEVRWHPYHILLRRAVGSDDGATIG